MTKAHHHVVSTCRYISIVKIEYFSLVSCESSKFSPFSIWHRFPIIMDSFLSLFLNIWNGCFGSWLVLFVFHPLLLHFFFGTLLPSFCLCSLLHCSCMPTSSNSSSKCASSFIPLFNHVWHLYVYIVWNVNPNVIWHLSTGIHRSVHSIYFTNSLLDLSLHDFSTWVSHSISLNCVKFLEPVHEWLQFSLCALISFILAINKETVNRFYFWSEFLHCLA